MRFIVDECTGPVVAKWLKGLGHDVFSVYDKARGLDDKSIIGKASNGNYILIANDKDFGEPIFRMRKLHNGVILMRLKDERSRRKITVLHRLLKSYSEQLTRNFIILTEKTVRIIEGKGDNIPIK